MEDSPDRMNWFPDVIPAVKAIRHVTGLELAETLTFMANIFGFEGDYTRTGWIVFTEWSQANRVSLTSVQGPHAVTILKAIAAKHGRLNVSTGQ